MKNLNPWYALLWRRLTRKVRRAFFSFDTPLRRKLYAEKRYLAHPDEITEQARRRLGEINHVLGTDSLYHFTDEQAQEMAVLAHKILEELHQKRETRDDDQEKYARAN